MKQKVKRIILFDYQTLVNTYIIYLNIIYKIILQTFLIQNQNIFNKIILKIKVQNGSYVYII